MDDGTAQEARIAELVRVLAKVAAGDFSEKPDIIEAEDEVNKFALAVRFMIDDLEVAREDQERRRQDLERANSQLRDLSEMKTRFINTAAHELNTPLTPIRIQLHMLRTGTLGALTPAQQKAVDVVGRNLERLSLLVGDVLDAARLQSEHMRLVKRPARLGKLAADAVDTLRPQAEAARVTLVLDGADDAEMEIDGQRITQVLFNLLSNALKFTPAGGRVTLGVAVEDGEARVTVTDTGPGLTYAQRDRLFAPFSQVHDPMTHTVGGTGLGLFISRGIVEQHGGRMWCDSPGPGHGSTFGFALPLLPPLATGPVRFPGLAPEERTIVPEERAKKT